MQKAESYPRRTHIPMAEGSLNYYADPVYSFDDSWVSSEEQGLTDEGADEYGSTGNPCRQPLDEPVESWGWVNNVN